MGQQTGALVVTKGEGAAGCIYVESGRVCWATSSETRGLLNHLLIQRASIDVDHPTLRKAYERCRDQGSSLVAELALTCALPRDDVIEVLFEHTLGAINEMIETKEGLRFLPHKLGSYSAGHSFSFTDMYVALSGSSYQKERFHARTVLRRIISRDACGLAFSRDTTRTPLSIQGARRVRTTDLEELSEWLAHTLDVGGALWERTSRTIVRSPLGGSALLWQDKNCIFAAFCSNESSLAFALGRLQQEQVR